jgi:hypothetical protein
MSNLAPKKRQKGPLLQTKPPRKQTNAVQRSMIDEIAVVNGRGSKSQNKGVEKHLIYKCKYRLKVYRADI